MALPTNIPKFTWTQDDGTLKTVAYLGAISHEGNIWAIIVVKDDKEMKAVKLPIKAQEL